MIINPLWYQIIMFNFFMNIITPSKITDSMEYVIKLNDPVRA